MPNQTIETYDGKGKLIETRQVNVSQEAVNADEVQNQLATMRDNLTVAWSAMNTLATGTGTFATNVQRDQAIRDIASAVRFALRTEGRIVRHVLGDFSGTD